MQLDISRAMVTTHVARFERYLGVRLINRATRRLSLTDDGLPYHVRCLNILAELDDAESAVQRSRGVARGRLRVEMPIAFARHRVIPVLPRFLAANRELTLEVDLENRMTDILAQGYYCGIRSGQLSNLTLVARRIGSLDWVTCASPSCVRRYGTPRQPEDRANHNRIVWLSARTMQPAPWQFQQDGETRTIGVRGNLHFNAMEDIAWRPRRASASDAHSVSWPIEPFERVISVACCPAGRRRRNRRQSCTRIRDSYPQRSAFSRISWSKCCAAKAASG